MVIAEEGVWEVERRVVRDEGGGGCMFDVSEPILQRQNKWMKRLFFVVCSWNVSADRLLQEYEKKIKLRR